MNCLWAASLSTFKALEPWLGPGGIVTLRYGLSAIICAVLWPWLPGQVPRGRDLLKAAVIGALVFCCGPRMQTAGVQMGQAGDAALLMALEPLIGAVAAALILHEHVARRRWLGFAFGVLGVALISKAWEADFHWGQLAANGLILASLFTETAYSVIGKPVLEKAGPFKLLAVGLFVGTALNLAWDGPKVAAEASHLTPFAWSLVLYLAVICTVIGYGLWFVILRETPMNITVMSIFIQPVAGLIIAILCLGEHPHWGQLWGSVAIISGLVLGLWRTRDQPQPTAPILTRR